MTAMTKKAFRKNLGEFRIQSVGAACFKDPLGGKHCANNLTQQQAQDFAKFHGLQLTNWVAGGSCVTVQCP